MGNTRRFHPGLLLSVALVAALASCGDSTSPTGGGGSAGDTSEGGEGGKGGSTSTVPQGGTPETGGMGGTGGAPSTCGNGEVDAGEACDGTNLAGDTCETHGFDGGELGCNGDCTFDESGCMLLTCGNGELDAGEVCDDTLLNGQTCSSQGFASGALACAQNCAAFDTTACVPAVCGNGTPEGFEECDDGNTVDGDGCEHDCKLPGSVVTVCQNLTPLPNGETCAVTAGNGAKLITGDVLKPGEVLKGGQVLVNAAGQITCVACDCTAQAAGATEITCPTGVVSPGLINVHDHITFTQNDPYTVTPERYEHRHQWRTGAMGHTEVNAAGQASGDQVRWGELRFLLGGATSTVGSGSAAGFLRNLDSASNQEGLGQGVVNFETFPLDDSSGTQRNGDCNYGPAPDTEATIANDPAYLPHIAEGIGPTARNEFLCTSSTTFDTAAPGVSHDLVQPQSAFIHSIGLKAPDYAQMAQDSTSLIWSPRSNITLYGDTAVVTEATNLGVLVALGTDWVVSGSMNMLRELKCADDLNTDQYGGFFTDEELWRMATLNGAIATATDDATGVLATNHVADISIFNGATNDGYRAVIDAQPEDVVLVMRGGKPLYGDDAIIQTIPSTGACDVLDVCGVQKRVCAQSEIGKTLPQLQTAVAGIYPAFFCSAVPDNEPSCVPERSNTPPFPNGSVNGSTLYTGVSSASDTDGDGIPNASDDCPTIFNPVRPVDNGAQADFDNDGVGDACDVCPLDPNTTTCTVFNPNDSDSDGVDNLSDNCPADANTDQADADTDGKGDVCDACPLPNPGNQSCPATIYDVKNGTLPPGNSVLITNAIVTGKASNGFFAQVKEGDAGYLGADFSGIFVFTGANSPNNAALIGNRVTIDASIQDFNGEIELSGITSVVITSPSVEAPPAPIAETAANVTTGGARAAELEGVIVALSNTTVTAPFNAFNEFTVDDSTATMLVDDLLYLTSPPPAANDFYQQLTGIVAFRNSSSKLHPRAAGDLVAGFGLVGFDPQLSFIDVGQLGAPTFPTPLTVTLSLPAPTPTFVAVVSADPSLITVVGGGVTVPQGQTSAQVLVNGIAAGTTTLTATLGAASLDAGVTVVAAGQQPTLTDLTPPSPVIAPNATVTFTVTLDIPAPAGGTVINLSINPANAGAIPATVTVPTNQLSATFDYTHAGAATSVTVTATLGAGMEAVNVTVVAGGSTLLFSEYVEGTSNNKAVEIKNTFATAFDLGANSCHINRYSNGGTTPAAINLTGTIAPGDVFVVCSNQAGAGLLPLCDATDAQLNFNGDDAVSIECGATVYDIIGQIGFDPGTQWGTPPTSTLNQTIRRKCTVTTGDTLGSDAFDPVFEWGGFSVDDFTGLGDPACAP